LAYSFSIFFSLFQYFSFLYWDFNGIFLGIPVTFFHMFNSNLDSSKIKSKSFTTTVDQYSQVAVTVSGTIIAAISARYLVIVQEDNHTLRLFGNIGQYQLNSVNKGTIVNVMVFYF
jgi:hypothetical protein